MKFFCDNNISYKIAKALSVLAQPTDKVIHLTEDFPADTADEEWISQITKEGYIVISGDPKIAKRAHQKALVDSELTVFFLAKGWMNLSFWKQASGLIKTFPEIMRLARENPSKCIFEITKGGQIIKK
ncbi:MAG: hypothetical protein ACE5G1_15220 [bacterium]